MKVKLLSPRDLFATDQLAEVLSPLVEPADASASTVIERLLGELGFPSERPSTMIKFKILLPSFLMWSSRLQRRLERKGKVMVIFISHGGILTKAF